MTSHFTPEGLASLTDDCSNAFTVVESKSFSMSCSARSVCLQNTYFMRIRVQCVLATRVVSTFMLYVQGMYGAPLICRGRAVGMLMAPDAQWTNCTGFSTLIHIFSSRYLASFMDCVSTYVFSDSH